MIQYIINSSLIWLSFLMLYGFLFRKESFHQYNRIYLLLTLLAGIVLPLISLNVLMPVNSHTPILYTTKVHEIKNTILVNPVSQISTPIVQSSDDIGQIIWTIYVLGVLVGILFFIKEVFSLVQLYKNGKRYYESDSVIIETQTEHAAFSFFNLVFIQSKQDYTELEWKLLLNHEKEHGRQLHSLDNLLLIMARIFFWFNPLIYVYYKKLRIVHEFQADKIAADNIAQYGSFLLDLNLLQRAPLLTHSFNYSPIKIRIAMLTKTKSSRMKLLKYLMVLPLFTLLIIFCTKTSISGNLINKSTKVRYKENVIEFGEFKVIPSENRKAMNQQNSMFLNASIPDSLPVYNYATGVLLRMEKLLIDRIPTKINGKLIYGNEPQYLISKFDAEFTAPVINSAKHLDEYLFLNLKNEINQLEDGTYAFQISNLVIDEFGKVGYYDQAKFDISMPPDQKNPNIKNELKLDIEKKFKNLLEGDIRFKPALKNNKAINVRASLGNYIIVVKDHKAMLVDRPGC